MGLDGQKKIAPIDTVDFESQAKTWTILLLNFPSIYQDDTCDLNKAYGAMKQTVISKSF